MHIWLADIQHLYILHLPVIDAVPLKTHKWAIMFDLFVHRYIYSMSASTMWRSLYIFTVQKSHYPPGNHHASLF